MRFIHFIVLLLCLYLPVLAQQKCADLVILEILKPTYDYASKGTVIKVLVANKGMAKSGRTEATIRDIDISAVSGMELGLNETALYFLEENANLAQHYAKDSSFTGEITEFDYDEFFSATSVIDPIKPFEERILVFKLPGIWVYDPNCEFEIVLDEKNLLEECNEQNNRKVFVDGG